MTYFPALIYVCSIDLGQVALDAVGLLCTSLITKDEETGSQGEGDEYSDSPDLELRRRVSLLLSKESMDGILELLHQPADVSVAVSAAKILRTFHIRAPKETEAALLECPAGVQRIVDGLRDPREVVRNLIVLALGSLTTVCVELCEAVAFQEGLEQLFNIMSLEGMLNGGEVVRDCLIVCMNVIKNFAIAQRLFCEGHAINILHRLIDLRRLSEGLPSEVSVSVLQEQIMVSAITLLRLSLAHRRGQSVENQERKQMQQSVACAAGGLLSELLVHVSLSRADPYSFTPSSVRSIACEAVGDLMTGNCEIQHFMDQMLVMDLGKGSISLSSLLVERILEYSSSKQSVVAIWNCLHSLYAGNELGAAQALSHVLAPPPPPVGVDIDLELWNPPPAVGNIVLSALEALETHSCTSTIVDRAIIACKVLALLLKEGGENTADITLRLKVRSPDGEPLLSFVTRHAEDAYEKETHGRMVLCVEVLKVLCQWLNGSSLAVESLLSSPEALFLYELAAKAELKGNSEKEGDLSAKTATHYIACLILGLCFLQVTDEHEKEGKLDGCSSHTPSVLQAIESKVGLRRLASGIDILKRRVEAATKPTSRGKTVRYGRFWTPDFCQLVTNTAENTRSRIIEYFHAEWKRGEGDERVKMMENELKGLSMTILVLEQQLERKNEQALVATSYPLPATVKHQPLHGEELKNTTLGNPESMNAEEGMLKEENVNLLAENAKLKSELVLARTSSVHATPPSPNAAQRESEMVLVLREKISELELELESQKKTLSTTEESLPSQLTCAQNDRATFLKESNQAKVCQTKVQVELSNTKAQLIRETEQLEEARKEVDELKKEQDCVKQAVRSNTNVVTPNEYHDKFELLSIIAQLDVVVGELVCVLESSGDTSAIEVAMNSAAATCIKHFGVFVSYQ